MFLYIVLFPNDRLIGKNVKIKTKVNLYCHKSLTVTSNNIKSTDNIGADLVLHNSVSMYRNLLEKLIHFLLKMTLQKLPFSQYSKLNLFFKILNVTFKL